MVTDPLFTYYFLKLVKKIDRVKSQTAYSDLQFLFLMARKGWGEGALVEIGSSEGKSAIAMALGSKLSEREKVFCVDPHIEGTKDIFLKNLDMMALSDYVVPIFGFSEEARKSFDKKIRMIFIDGDHRYEAVKKDILLWKDLLIDGGVMAFHDYNWEGVARAVGELIRDTDEFMIEGTTGCTIFASKKITKNRKLFREVRIFNRTKDLVRPWKALEKQP
ncbi:MAG: hypothetical protein A2987_05825 [Omnitrophica bacterium RIFCSPLOWO2_01_FULL_45_10]|nr:MAG: hypothetical protein A2987_05825 [Omnitrophica bacterium RIFCSPLOWO2_01_FULL_45_10]